MKKEFNNWREIKEWAVEQGFDLLAKRLQLNNDCWNSCGEFGRSQVAICDSIRLADTLDEQLEIAGAWESELATDMVLELVAG